MDNNDIVKIHFSLSTPNIGMITIGKTSATKIISNAFNAKYARIQCTPDLLPSDIIGTQIFNYKTNEFVLKLIEVAFHKNFF